MTISRHGTVWKIHVFDAMDSPLYIGNRVDAETIRDAICFAYERGYDDGLSDSNMAVLTSSEITETVEILGS